MLYSAPVRIDAKSGMKVRPCVVVSSVGTGSLIVCPVSSRPAFDTGSVPLTLNDFSCGGLDLFGESYSPDIEDVPDHGPGCDR